MKSILLCAALAGCAPALHPMPSEAVSVDRPIAREQAPVSKPEHKPGLTDSDAQTVRLHIELQRAQKILNTLKSCTSCSPPIEDPTNTEGMP